VEYALNREPRQQDQGPLSTLGLSTVGESTYLLISFTHNRTASDVQITFEGSADLTQWSSAAAETVGNSALSLNAEQVTVRVPVTGLPAYAVRMRLTKSAP
jgi:hypothetical protein